MQTLLARSLADKTSSHHRVLSGLDKSEVNFAATGETAAGWEQGLDGAADSAASLVEDARECTQMLADQIERYSGLVNKRSSLGDAEVAKLQEVLDSIVDSERVSRVALALVEADKAAVEESVSSSKEILIKLRKRGEEAKTAEAKSFLMECSKGLDELKSELVELEVKDEFVPPYKEILDKMRKALSGVDALEESLSSYRGTFGKIDTKREKTESDGETMSIATLDIETKVGEVTSTSTSETVKAAGKGEASAATTKAATSADASLSALRAGQREESDEEDTMIRQVAMEAIRAKMKELDWKD